MKTICWLEDVFRKDVPNVDKVQERDLYGRNAKTLCLNNPDYRNFLTVVRSTRVLQHGFSVVLRVGRGKIALVELEIVLLLAVIRQRPTWNLSPGDTAPVGEDRQGHAIHGRSFLKEVEHFAGALVDKRNRTWLDAARETPAPTADCKKLLRFKSESDMSCSYRPA